MNVKGAIRNNIKAIVKIFDVLTRWLPIGKFDVLIIYDFEGNNEVLESSLSQYKVKSIRYNQSRILTTAYLIRRARVIYVDNINLAVATLDNIEATVIQYWHATSAVKKFGLPIVTNEKERATRKKEFDKYDYVTVNSEYMAEKFKLGFGFEEGKLAKTGCIQSAQLFDENDITPYFEYIVYAPTFRWNSKHDKQAIEFIENFKSDKYKLIYSLHPKLDVIIKNEDAIDATGTDIRCYFAGAKLVISDYSSLLIDASLQCQHAVMYAYDYDCYKQDPGLYISKDNFWGYYTEDEIDLLKYIHGDKFIEHDLNYIKERFFTYDDINSVDRVAKLAIDRLKK